jgi:ABC-type sugar transport system ATPase subunit
MADVQIEGLAKRFGSVAAIEGVNLSVRDGEFVVLIGPSGSGKTTILRLISGLDVPTQGSIRIGGVLMNSQPPKDRKVAMVFQNYALYPHMSVYDNMAFGLRTRGTEKGEIHRLVREAAEMLSITTLLARKPRQLSGGEKQRVALGRAIVRRPEVFLMDEPMSSLDAPLRAQTRLELIRLHRTLGITTIYVTHDQTEAMSMGQRIVVMSGGKVQQIGAPWDVYESPSNVFTAKFIGTPAINLIPQEQVGRRVMLGVRPENVLISADGEGLRGQVVSLEILGADTHVTIKVNDSLIVARVNSRTRPGVGDRVALTFEKSIFFDAETGERIWQE